MVAAAPAPFPAELDPTTMATVEGRQLLDTIDPVLATRDTVRAVGDTDGDGQDDYLFMVDTSGDRYSDTYYLIAGSTSINPLVLSRLQASDGVALIPCPLICGRNVTASTVTTRTGTAVVRVAPGAGICLSVPEYATDITPSATGAENAIKRRRMSSKAMLNSCAGYC